MTIVGIYDTAQRIFPFAFPILWFVPAIVLYARFSGNQHTYLCRLPPIDHHQALDTYAVWSRNPPGTYKRLLHALWQRQDNPDLEQMRREMWRSYGLFVM